MNFCRIVAVATLATALLAPAAHSQVNAYHDQSGASHQAKWNQLTGLGYRPIALSIYGTAASPQYAAVWVQRAGPAFVGFHGLTGAEYQTFTNTWWPLGYRPKLLTALGTAGNPRFAGCFELTNAGGWSSHGLTQQEFWDERSAADGLGFDVTAVDVYGDANDPRYVVAFGPVAAGQSEIVSVGDAGFQEHFDALTPGHARPTLVAFNDADRYVSLWQSNDVGDWIAHHDMTSAEYQNYTNLYWPARYPISVQGSGSGGGRRFAAVWAPTDLPPVPTWTKTGVVVPQFAAFDNWVQNWMTTNETRAASLAIVRDGRLVYARGYTRALPGYPITQPTSLFRIASCSKPITSIAAHQHFERPAFNMQANDSLLGSLPGLFALDPRVAQITLHSLLTHQGGWDRNVSPDPTIGQDPTIATLFGLSLPIPKVAIRNYQLGTQLLDFTPNTDSQYSNFGMSLMGQVLEAKNPGVSYPQIVQRDIFGPLGLVRPRIGGSLKSDLAPGEVYYHPYTPMLSRSVMDNSQPWVAGQYGALNIPNRDSHGGWVMAAPDYAKILAAFDLGASNPLLGQDQTDAMWSVEPGYSTLMRGWYGQTVSDGFGGSVEMNYHNGRLFGSVSLVARRADGLSFVFFTNGDKNSLSGSGDSSQLNSIANQISLWPSHDLFPTVSIPPFIHRDGSLTGFGSSCYGSVGFPTFAVSGSLDIGEQIDFTVGNIQPNRVAITALGLVQTNISLAFLGAPNCRLYTDPILLLNGVSGAAGSATMAWQAPADPSAIGLTVIAQGAVLDPTANPFGMVTTHGWQVKLGGWQ